MVDEENFADYFNSNNLMADLDNFNSNLARGCLCKSWG